MKIVDINNIEDDGCSITINADQEEQAKMIRLGLKRLIEEYQDLKRPILVLPPGGIPNTVLEKAKKLDLSDEEAFSLIQIAIEKLLEDLGSYSEVPETWEKKLGPIEDVHEKVWGHERWIANNSMYCGKILRVNQKKRCSIHFHKKKHETFYVSSGAVWMEVEDEGFFMQMDDRLVVPPWTKHRYLGVAPASEIIEFSTQHFECDSYRVEPSGHVPQEFWRKIMNTNLGNLIQSNFSK